MDIAKLLESHRWYMLEVANTMEYESEEESESAQKVMAVMHDRATTKTLLDLYRSGQTGPNGEAKPLGQAALTTPPPKKSNRLKAGSKGARDRALKAGETRRKNLADKKAAATSGAPGTPGVVDINVREQAPPEGGAA